MVIFHIDVNNAFLSWEAVYRLTTLNESLDLRDIPSVIGGDETKRHGILPKHLRKQKRNVPRSKSSPRATLFTKHSQAN